MTVQPGDTFLLGQGSHLWIVISDPAKHKGDFVIVNLTSDQFRAGKECELNVGDHPWVKHKSYVSFGDARRVTPIEEAKIQLYLSQGHMKRYFPVKEAVLQRIIGAAKTSKAIPADLNVSYSRGYTSLLACQIMLSHTDTGILYPGLHSGPDVRSSILSIFLEPFFFRVLRGQRIMNDFRQLSEKRHFEGVSWLKFDSNAHPA